MKDIEMSEMFHLVLVILLFGGSLHLNTIRNLGDKKVNKESPLFSWKRLIKKKKKKNSVFSNFFETIFAVALTNY